MLTGRGNLGDSFGGRARRLAGNKSGALLTGHWNITCRDKDGNVKWSDTLGHVDPRTGLWVPHNLIVNEGLDHALDIVLSGGVQITSWFLGLTDGTPTPAAGDTMASHAGWAEVQAYDEAARVAWSDGGVSGQSVDNSGAPATFTINADTTVIGGAFLTSDSTKGGTSGTLFSVGAFSAGDKSLDSADTLDVTATFTAADDGV